jgi:short-subunit dehydrogenase
MSETRELVVVAGCGSVMGSAVARTFAGEGHPLALIARNRGHLEKIAGEIVGEPGPSGPAAVEVYTGDITDPDVVKGVFADIRKRQGDPAVLVYNLATMVKTPPSELTAKEMEDTLPAMFFGALYTTSEVLPAMKDAGRGTLLYTGGGFGILPARFSASHSVGKAALRNWVQNLHGELEPLGIHAATVTITRPVSDGGAYDRAAIAAHYLDLHRQPRGAWDWEIIHREL